jgi:hypothetical protein
MKRLFIFAVAAFACVGIAQAQESKSYQCQKGSDTRSISVQSGKDGCSVVYKKGGKSAGGGRALWHYKAHTEMCQTQADQFMKKLQGMGMTCGPAS